MVTARFSFFLLKKKQNGDATARGRLSVLTPKSNELELRSQTTFDFDVVFNAPTLTALWMPSGSGAE